ncbi:hypothetical protein [Maribacter sp. 2307ULW6-5]|uniref:hypothetical protein n=1 Tax=Maribacter sp. 2307ULW6-5 TaxID=3386275 RepID=UPI0039BCB185
MQKAVRSILVFTFLFGCADAPRDTEQLADSGWEVAPADLPKLGTVNAKARQELENWQAYKDFEAGFNRIYDTEYREDFVLVVDDLVEKQKALEASEYPERFNAPQVKGRQKVVKTFILKVKGDLIYRQNPEASIKQLIEAFNDLRSQFNIMVNYVLPDELIQEGMQMKKDSVVP